MAALESSGANFLKIARLCGFTVAAGEAPDYIFGRGDIRLAKFWLLERMPAKVAKSGNVRE